MNEPKRPIILTCPQRSDEWFNARTGRPTASSAAKIITSTGKPSTQARAYLYELVAERAGYVTPPFEPTEAMLEGIRREEESRDALAFQLGVDIEEVGMVICPVTGASASPDGLSDGFGVELKNPKPGTYYAELDAGKVPAKYLPQIHWSLAVSGLDLWYYGCYLSPADFIVHEVERSKYTETVAQAIADFTGKLDETCERLGVEWEDGYVN